jgi:hypothetical protein
MSASKWRKLSDAITRAATIKIGQMRFDTYLSVDHTPDSQVLLHYQLSPPILGNELNWIFCGIFEHGIRIATQYQR